MNIPSMLKRAHYLHPLIKEQTRMSGYLPHSQPLDGLGGVSAGPDMVESHRPCGSRPLATLARTPGNLDAGVYISISVALL